MQLNSITMNNFRQYYGEQKVEFAKGDKNITIIFGENGKGKTGLFRALIFGLFGDRYINQDNKNDDIHIVNFNSLEENLGSPVESWVEVKFTHKQKEYIIKRKIAGCKVDNKILEQLKETEISIIDENGNYENKNDLTENEKNKLIASVFDPKIKDFFLFDAERIETLAKTNKEAKLEVESGIKNLLNIDKLQKAINITNSLEKEEKAIINKNSNDVETVRCQENIETIKSDIKGIEEKIDIKKTEESSCQEELESIEKKLGENKNIKLIQDKIKEKKNIKAIKKELLNAEKRSLRENSFNKCHMLLMDPAYYTTKEYLGQVVIKQNDLIPLEIIEKSLKDQICSCCKVDLSENTEAINQLNKLKNNFKRSELTPLISEINNTINEFSLEKDMTLENIKKQLFRIREIKNEIDLLNDEIDELNAEISGESNGIKDLEELEKSKKKFIKDKENIKLDIIKLEQRKNSLESDLSREELKYKKLLSDNIAIKFEVQKLKYIETLNKSLKNILNDYSEAMRESLMKETTEIFTRLIDKKDKDLISKININSKYEIQIINRLETIITQDISQGQRQIVALAFIAALAKVAGGSNSSIDFPLFMDTPFGRISGNNRDNLIKNIPLLANQWILLLTDTELTLSEESKIKEVGKLGKWYKLEQISDGHSEIQEVDLNESIATRR